MFRLARLTNDNRGASIVELALVAPVLASLLIGMVDLSRAYFPKLELQQAAQRSIEKIQQSQAEASNFNVLQAETAATAQVPARNVAVDYWLQCNGARQNDYESVCPSGQTYERWVSIDITGTFKPIFKSKHFPKANSDGTFTLHGTARMRTQ